MTNQKVLDGYISLSNEIINSYYRFLAEQSYAMGYHPETSRLAIKQEMRNDYIEIQKAFKSRSNYYLFEFTERINEYDNLSKLFSYKSFDDVVEEISKKGFDKKTEHKVRVGHKKYTYKYTDNGQTKTYNSLTEASRDTGIPVPTIISHLKRKSGLINGNAYKWEYV